MTTKGYLFIRRVRIEAQLAQLEETSAGQLHTNTMQFQPPSTKRQNAMAPLSVRSMILIPTRGQRDQGQLKVEGTVISGPKTYDSTILFLDVKYEDADRSDNITFVAVDKKEYHVMPIQMNMGNAEVRCTCLDFYFTFSKWNETDKSLYGEPPAPYTPKTDRASRNPQQTPGMCKHLLKLIQELKNERLVR
jgi:hypothetical protein